MRISQLDVSLQVISKTSNDLLSHKEKYSYAGETNDGEKYYDSLKFDESVRSCYKDVRILTRKCLCKGTVVTKSHRAGRGFIMRKDIECRHIASIFFSVALLKKD